MINPNYLQAASNRIVATAQYLESCPKHGERLLVELEVPVRAASATVDYILAAVDEREEEEEHVKIGGTLRQRRIDVQGSFTQTGDEKINQVTKHVDIPQTQYIDKVQLEAAGVGGWPSTDELWAMALADTSEPDPEVLALLDDEQFMEEIQRQSTPWWSCGQDGEACWWFRWPYPAARLAEAMREGCGRLALGIVAGSLRGSRFVSLGLLSAYVCSSSREFFSSVLITSRTH